MTNLSVFHNNFVSYLEEHISDNMDFYKANRNDINYTSEAILPSSLQIPDLPPTLVVTTEYQDIENAIKLYNYLSQLNETQASDIRLWSYMTHVTFKEYARARWPVGSEDSEDKIYERWFFKGSRARSLWRNAISRLWWAVHLTVAPWESDDYFKSITDKTDRYVYTKTLLKIEDLAAALMERRLSRSKRILIAMLEYVRRHEEFAYKRDFYRNLLKEVNLDLGYKKIMMLSFEDLLAEIDNIAHDLGTADNV